MKYIVISVLFVVYAIMFIQSASFIAIDGHRYYTVADDALISIRYAWNFSHGNGLVWNVEEKIEGITNPLFTVLCAVITLYFDKRVSILVMQIFAIITLLGTAFIFKKIAEYLNLSNATSLLLFIVPLFYYPLFFWTMRGMEVGLICFFLSLALLFFIRNNIINCAISLSIAFLVRPDVVIVMLVFAFFVYKANRKESLNYILICLNTIALVELLRHLYYGQLLPNTYILKMTGMSTIDRIMNGLPYDISVLKDTGFLIFASFVSIRSIYY